LTSRLALLLHIAWRHIVMRQRQTAVAVGGVAVGVGFFLAVSALMVGSQNDFIKTLVSAAPHIIIYDELRSPPPQPGVRAFNGPDSTVALHGYKLRNEVRGIKDWQAILHAVNETPGAEGSPACPAPSPCASAAARSRSVSSASSRAWKARSPTSPTNSAPAASKTSSGSRAGSSSARSSPAASASTWATWSTPPPLPAPPAACASSGW